MKTKLGILFASIVVMMGVLLWDKIEQRQPIKDKVASTPSIISYQQAPQVDFLSLEGEELNLDDIKEPLLFINFWASWCTPCIAEIPDMISMIKDFGGNAALILVSQDDAVEKAKQFRKKTEGPDGGNLHVYWVWDEEKEIARQFGTFKVPETIILNKQREMVKKVVGAQPWTAKEWQKFLGK